MSDPHTDTESRTQTGSHARTGPRFEPGRRELWLLVAFLATIVVADRVLARLPERYLVPPQVLTNQLQLYAHAEREAPVDALVVGSSRVQAGVDPNLITDLLRSPRAAGEPEGGAARSPECARLFVQGMRAWTLADLAAGLLADRPPSALLVVGLEARYFVALPFEAAEPIGLRLLGDTGDLLTTDPSALPAGQWATLAVAPFRGVQAPWNLPLLLAPDLDAYVDHLHATRGLPEREFRPLSRRELGLALALGEEIDEREGGPVPAELDPFQVAAFERALDALERSPARVVFVRLPVEPPFQATQAEAFAAYEREIVGEVRARGFEYLDLNAFPHLLRPDFFDNPTHLNAVGRTEASRALVFELLGPALLGTPPAGFDARAEYARVAARPLWDDPELSPPVPAELRPRVDALLAEREDPATPEERRPAVDAELLELRRRTVERLRAAWAERGWAAFEDARGPSEGEPER